jgi:hypothetical protein
MTEAQQGVPTLPDHEFHRGGEPPKARVTKRAVDRLTSKRKLVGPCAVPGISLTNYAVGPQGKGWGGHCTGAMSGVLLSNGVKGTCRAEIAALSTLVMNECIRRGYNIRQSDTGCFNCRKIAGTDTWSNHAWALAWDINWQSNPYTSGTQHDIPDWMAKLFNRYGFAWGGDYTGGKRDYMHMEFMGSPAQAAAATALAWRELGGAGGGGSSGGGTSSGGAVAGDGILEEGDSGESVRTLQRVMKAWYPKDLGYVEVDGEFGPNTKRAVTFVQTKLGVTADGVAGPVTLGKLGLSGLR